MDPYAGVDLVCLPVLHAATEGSEDMPPRGVKSAKRARQYEKIKASAKKSGRSTATAKRIAAATVNKQRRQAGEAKTVGRKRKAAKKTSARQR